jgi:hypothetical protein
MHERDASGRKRQHDRPLASKEIERRRKAHPRLVGELSHPESGAALREQELGRIQHALVANSKTFLITGVSSGLLRAFVHGALAADHRVIGTVRRAEDAEIFAASERAFPLLLDVTDIQPFRKPFVEYGIERTDIFIEPKSGDNSAGVRASGADMKNGHSAGSDAALTVSVDVNGDKTEALKKAFHDMGAAEVVER